MRINGLACNVAVIGVTFEKGGTEYSKSSIRDTPLPTKKSRLRMT